MTGQVARIGVFAKTPGLTPAKTRLAADAGAELAEAFYRKSLEAVSAVMGEVAELSSGSIQPVWALAEEQAPGLEQWSRFPAIWTGEGGLGTRLFSVSDRLFAEADLVMLAGTDSPQLQPQVFLEAFALLQQGDADWVCGPAEDGGFYLFASRVPVSREIWESVPYSRDDTLARLEERLSPAIGPGKRLPKALDVDKSDDLARLRGVLTANQQSLNPAQKDLLRWLDLQV